MMGAVMVRLSEAALESFYEELLMNRRPLLVGLVAFATLGAGYAIAASEKAPAAAENQDARETRLVMLKLPAMV
jgi:hypothetical protein